MKKAILFMVVAVTLVVAGCATTSAPSKVKCPSCGYEFDVETKG